MSYIGLINHFWELDQEWQFSSHETRLYFLLLQKANRLKWAESPKISIETMTHLLGVSDKQVVRKAQTRLKEAGLIDYISQPGRGRKTEYVICESKETTSKRADKTVGKRVGKTVDKMGENSTLKPTVLDKRVDKRGANPTLLHLLNYNINNKDVVVEYNNDNNAESSEKNNGISPEKTYVELLDVDAATEALRHDQIWLEAECMKHDVEPSDIIALLDKFPAHCRGMGEDRKTLQRFKFHFDHLLRKQKYQSSQNSYNETDRQDKFSRRRGVDPSALRPEDYT